MMDDEEPPLKRRRLSPTDTDDDDDDCTPQQLVLTPEQAEAKQRMDAILARPTYGKGAKVLACWPTGTGKTVGGGIAYMLEAPRWVLFCSSTIYQSTWKPEMDKYGVAEGRGLVLSWHNLQKGCSDGTMARGLLVVKDKNSVQLTDRGRAVFGSGRVLVIFDESQESATPNTVRQRGMLAVCDTLHANPESTSIFLSASPITDKTHVWSVTRQLNIHSSPTAAPSAAALIETRFFAQLFDPDTVRAIEKSFLRQSAVARRVSNEMLTNEMFELWCRVIQPHVAVTIETQPLRGTYVQLLASVDDDASATGALQTLLQVQTAKDTVKKHTAQEMQQLRGQESQAMMDLERFKLKRSADELARVLETQPTAKAVIIFKYAKYNFEWAVECARRIVQSEPLIITGEVKPEVRAARIRLFNQHNDQHRVLLCSYQAIQYGVSLHDTSEGGRFPRYVMGTSTGRYLSVEQALRGRFERHNCTSWPVVAMVFARSSSISEKTILRTLRERSSAQRRSTDSLARTPALHAGEWPTVTDLLTLQPDTDGDKSLLAMV